MYIYGSLERFNEEYAAATAKDALASRKLGVVLGDASMFKAAVHEPIRGARGEQEQSRRLENLDGVVFSVF